MTNDLPERIAEKIRIDISGCWEWTASRRGGYGQVRWQGGTPGAHVVVYRLLMGEIPAGLQLDHLCRNRGCVNPEHLEPVTQRVNVLRGIGSAAENARKVACIHGHRFTAENTYVGRDGHRQCRTCQRAALRRFRERQQRIA